MGKIIKKAESTKLFGKDDDLRTPSHDEIMIWLNSAVDTYLSKWANIKRTWQLNELTFDRSRDEHSFDIEKMPAKPNIQLIGKKWEQPITRGQSQILVAVPDMVVKFKRPKAYINNKLEVSDIWLDDCLAWFEVKSKITSLGETLRQINIYREYSPSKSHWFLVSKRPRNDFIQILTEHGITFIEYDGSGLIQDECNIDGEVYKIPDTGLSEFAIIDH